MKRIILLLLVPLAAAAQEPSGSVFMNGFARITQDGKSWYADTTGRHAFDAGTPLGSANEGKTLVRKGAHSGMLGRNGEWLLPAAFDGIDTQWGDLWKVRKQGKQSWADSLGRLLLPLQFEEAGYLDGRYFDVKQNGRWGIYDAQAKQLIIPAAYEGFDYCGGCGRKADYLHAKKNGKWGVIDFKERQLAPFVYDHEHHGMRSDAWVASFSRQKQPLVLHLPTGKEYPDGEVLNNGMLVYRRNRLYGMVNRAGVEVLPPAYETINGVDADFAPVTRFISMQQKGRWGLADSSGRILVQPGYDEALTVVFDSLFTTQKDGLHVLLNAAGKHLLPDGITDLEQLKDARAMAFRKNGRYGLYHAATGHITPPVYDEVSELYSGGDWLKTCIRVVKGGWSGLLGPDGREVVPPQFDERFEIINAEGPPLITAGKGKRRALFNTAGRMIAPAKYYSFSQNLDNAAFIRVAMEDGDGFRIGIIDTTGAVVCPMEYDELTTLTDSLVLLRKEPQLFVMNTLTRERYLLPYTEAVRTGNPLVLAVKSNESYYLFDLQKRSAITSAYTQIGQFNGAVAVATRAGKTGLLQTDGRLALPLEHDFIISLKNGVALVVRGNMYGFADSSGKIIVPVEYDYDASSYSFEYQRGPYLVLRRSHDAGGYLTGVAGPGGKVLLQPEYHGVFFDTEHKGFLLEKNRRFGLATADGRVVVPVEYEDIVPQAINGYSGSFSYTWPLLCKKNGGWVYLNRNGQPLPLKIREVVPFAAGLW